MVVGYIGLVSIGLYLYVLVMGLIGVILVVTAFWMRADRFISYKRGVWVIGVGLVVLVFLGVGLIPFSAYVLIGQGWPGRYVYTEHRSFDTPDEAEALLLAETFDYALLPVSETLNLSGSSFHQGVLEYSLVPVRRANFLSNNVLFDYAIMNSTFNPYLMWGGRAITYVANCTYFPTLNVTLNATAAEAFTSKPVLFTSNNATIEQPWGSYLFDIGRPASFWRGGYLEISGYAGFEYERLGGYVGPLFLQLNFTNVYFVDMQLSIIRRGSGSYGWYDEFWFFQRVVVDSLGRLLFVSYHDFYIAWTTM